MISVTLNILVFVNTYTHNAFICHFIYLLFLNILTLPASGDFCPRLIAFANSLDPDQSPQTAGPSDDIPEKTYLKN